MGKAEILIGLDFTPTSDTTIEVGISLSEQMNCTPLLVHIDHINSNFNAVKTLNNNLGSQFELIAQAVKDDIQKKIFKQLKPWAATHQDLKSLLISGDLVSEFIKLAKENNCKMIVIGLNDEINEHHFFIGSIAERLVRASHIPVLIVKNKSIINIKNILIPYSISPVSAAAIEWGSVLSKYFDSQVSYVHIVEPANFKNAQKASLEPPSLEYIYPLKTESVSQIQKLINQQENNGNVLSHEIICEKNKKVRLLLSDYINEKRPDLVIMGTHARKGIERMYLGSIAEWILRASQSSLLITKTF